VSLLPPIAGWLEGNKYTNTTNQSKKMKMENTQINNHQNGSSFLGGDRWMLELRSGQVQEILGRPPKHIIRYGIAVVFGVIAGLFIGSYFFKYPDIISAAITVTTANLPANLVAKSSGRIDTLFVVEKQNVKQGEMIAVIENTADFKDVMRVKNYLAADTLVAEPQRLAFLPAVSLHLGSIQNSYHNYQKAINDYQIFVKTDYFSKKINIAKQQLSAQKSLVQTLQDQLSLEKQQFEIAKKLFKIDSALFEKQALTLLDFENAKQDFILAQQNFENAKINIENQKSAVLQLEENIIDLDKQYSDNINQLETVLNGCREALQNDIKNWEQAFLFLAPMDGTITFTKFWQKNQNITAGETLATIVPNVDAGNVPVVVGKIRLSPVGAGKVKIGQSVNVKFDNFPYMEYGMVKTTIRDISLVPIVENDQQFYILNVDFPMVAAAHTFPKETAFLQTNYNKLLPFSQQMTGTAEIITDDLRLLDRFI
jgi:HlyD family secretion protein